MERRLPRILLTKGFLVATLLLIPNFGMAQVDSTAGKTKKKWGVLPVPAFGYQPETRAYIGAVGLFTLNFFQDSLTRTSNAKAEVNYTWNRQLIVEVGWNVFSRQEKWFIEGLVHFSDYPDQYYGLGQNTRKSNQERFESHRQEIRLGAYRKWIGNWYLGPILRYRNWYGIRSLEEESQLNLKSGGRSSSLGAGILLDTRKNLLNPWQGNYVSLTWQEDRSFTGSEFSFRKFSADLRFYKAIKKRHLLAFQVRNESNFGNLPFFQAAALGSSVDMRGYFRGRYRDLHYLAAQVEYRVPLFWVIGMTAFGGVGDVAADYSRFNLPSVKPSYGAGLRVLVDKQENINLRFDYALGKDGASGFYVGFGEAF